VTKQKTAETEKPGGVSSYLKTFWC